MEGGGLSEDPDHMSLRVYRDLMIEAHDLDPGLSVGRVVRVSDTDFVSISPRRILSDVVIDGERGKSWTLKVTLLDEAQMFFVLLHRLVRFYGGYETAYRLMFQGRVTSVTPVYGTNRRPAMMITAIDLTLELNRLSRTRTWPLVAGKVTGYFSNEDGRSTLDLDRNAPGSPISVVSLAEIIKTISSEHNLEVSFFGDSESYCSKVKFDSRTAPFTQNDETDWTFLRRICEANNLDIWPDQEGRIAIRRVDKILTSTYSDADTGRTLTRSWKSGSGLDDLQSPIVFYYPSEGSEYPVEIKPDQPDSPHIMSSVTADLDIARFRMMSGFLQRDESGGITKSGGISHSLMKYTGYHLDTDKVIKQGTDEFTDAFKDFLKKVLGNPNWRNFVYWSKPKVTHHSSASTRQQVSTQWGMNFQLVAGNPYLRLGYFHKILGVGLLSGDNWFIKKIVHTFGTQYKQSITAERLITGAAFDEIRETINNELYSRV